MSVVGGGDAAAAAHELGFAAAMTHVSTAAARRWNSSKARRCRASPRSSINDMHAARALVAQLENAQDDRRIDGVVRELLALEPDFDAIDAVIFPPFTPSPPPVKHCGEACSDSADKRNDADSAPSRARSAVMLLDCGAHWVILGHSERRAAAETDAAINRKVHAALRLGLTPDRCGRRIAADHAAGRTHDHVVLQTSRVERVTPDDVAPASWRTNRFGRSAGPQRQSSGGQTT